MRTPATDAQFAEAKRANLTFKRTVAEVQEQIFVGDWSVAEYGDVPKSCREGGGYEFFLRRRLPDGFSFHEQGPRKMVELHSWMALHGWKMEPIPRYSEGIDNVVVMGSKRDGNVARLDVDLLPGVAADGTIDVLQLRATSTCEPGVAIEVLERLRGPYTGRPEDPGLPSLESPRDTPLFEPFDQKTPHPKPAESDQ
ncbi:MAG: hypothetical protein FJW64_08325 [Actinobacteria bacterium]|nr:hypothetical protein [Actinomycetota bacterium]